MNEVRKPFGFVAGTIMAGVAALVTACAPAKSAALNSISPGPRLSSEVSSSLAVGAPGAASSSKLSPGFSSGNDMLNHAQTFPHGRRLEIRVVTSPDGEVMKVTVSGSGRAPTRLKVVDGDGHLLPESSKTAPEDTAPQRYAGNFAQQRPPLAEVVDLPADGKAQVLVIADGRVDVSVEVRRSAAGVVDLQATLAPPVASMTR